MSKWSSMLNRQGARVVRPARDALVPFAVMTDLPIDENTDSATVRLAVEASVTENDVNRLLVEASQEKGHAYRARPGSWKLRL
jgi:hypothetical protein